MAGKKSSNHDGAPKKKKNPDAGRVGLSRGNSGSQADIEGAGLIALTNFRPGDIVLEDLAVFSEAIEQSMLSTDVEISGDDEDADDGAENQKTSEAQKNIKDVVVGNRDGAENRKISLDRCYEWYWNELDDRGRKRVGLLKKSTCAKAEEVLQQRHRLVNELFAKMKCVIPEEKEDTELDQEIHDTCGAAVVSEVRECLLNLRKNKNEGDDENHEVQLLHDLIDMRERLMLNGLRDGQGVLRLFPSVAFVNHSCNPNCNNLSLGDRTQLRALKTIKKGEEITWNYVQSRLRVGEVDVGDDSHDDSDSSEDEQEGRNEREDDANTDLLALSLEKRREWLQRRYDFLCLCQRCREEEASN